MKNPTLKEIKQYADAAFLLKQMNKLGMNKKIPYRVCLRQTLSKSINVATVARIYTFGKKGGKDYTESFYRVVLRMRDSSRYYSVTSHFDKEMNFLGISSLESQRSSEIDHFLIEFFKKLK